jgi:hypothetical protein
MKRQPFFRNAFGFDFPRVETHGCSAPYGDGIYHQPHVDPLPMYHSAVMYVAFMTRAHNQCRSVLSTLFPRPFEAPKSPYQHFHVLASSQSTRPRTSRGEQTRTRVIPYSSVLSSSKDPLVATCYVVDGRFNANCRAVGNSRVDPPR